MIHISREGVAMKTIVFLTADFANLSSDRKLNIMGAFNQIYATKFPAIHPSMHLVIELGMEPGEESGPHAMALYRINEDQTERITIFEHEFTFPPRKGGLMPKHTAIIGLRQVGFVASGTYEFVLHINGHYFDKVPLYLEQLEINQQG